MQRKDHLDGIAIAVLLVLSVSWGGQQVAVKLAAADVSPVMQAAIRSFGAALLVALWMIFRQQRIFGRDGTLIWGFAAGLLFAVEFFLIYWGLVYTNASRAVVFLYLSPFVVAIGSHWFVPSERLIPIQYAGLGIAFLGIVIAFGESLTLPSRQMLIGDTMLVFAAIFWGATTVVIKAGPLLRIAPAKTLLYQLAVSAALLPFASWLLNEPGIVRWSTTAIASLSFQTIWVAGITYLAWFWVIQHYPGPKAASITFTTPVFGVLAGWWILDEPITTSLLIAMVFIAAGIFLVNRVRPLAGHAD